MQTFDKCDGCGEIHEHIFTPHPRNPNHCECECCHAVRTRRTKKETEAWNVIADSLICLATSRPSGDDSVFDYWPNALEAVTFLYKLAITEEGNTEIEDYLIQHHDESCGHITDRLINVLAKYDVTVLIPELDKDSDGYAREYAARYTDQGLKVKEAY